VEKAFVVALAPVGEETTAVVLVIDELAVEIGLVVKFEDVEVDIILPYWSCVASVMLKECALSFGCGCIDSEVHGIKLVIEGQVENLEPPSLPSIITFHTYEGCVNATRFHRPLLPG